MLSLTFFMAVLMEDFIAVFLALLLRLCLCLFAAERWFANFITSRFDNRIILGSFSGLVKPFGHESLAGAGRSRW